jgi:hypothetical protein
MISDMNVSNVGRQCKRKPRLLARILAALIAFLQIGFSPVMVSAGSGSVKNGTKEPSPNNHYCNTEDRLIVEVRVYEKKYRCTSVYSACAIAATHSDFCI